MRRSAIQPSARGVLVLVLPDSGPAGSWQVAFFDRKGNYRGGVLGFTSRKAAQKHRGNVIASHKQQAAALARKPEKRTCGVCEKEFIPRGPKQKNCSPKCGDEAQRIKARAPAARRKARERYASDPEYRAKILARRKRTNYYPRDEEHRKCLQARRRKRNRAKNAERAITQLAALTVALEAKRPSG